MTQSAIEIGELVKELRKLTVPAEWVDFYDGNHAFTANELPKPIKQAIGVIESIAPLVKALEFYRDIKSQNSWEEFWQDIEDNGNRADVALEAFKAKMEGLK